MSEQKSISLSSPSSSPSPSPRRFTENRRPVYTKITGEHKEEHKLQRRFTVPAIHARCTESCTFPEFSDDNCQFHKLIHEIAETVWTQNEFEEILADALEENKAAGANPGEFYHIFGMLFGFFRQTCELDERLQWQQLKPLMQRLFQPVAHHLTQAVWEDNRAHVYRVLFLCFCCSEVLLHPRFSSFDLDEEQKHHMENEMFFAFPTANPFVFVQPSIYDRIWPNDEPEVWPEYDEYAFWLEIAELFYHDPTADRPDRPVMMQDD